MTNNVKANDVKEEGKLPLVPKLRFPEFQITPAWEATTIGALGSFYYGKSAPKWSLEAEAPTHCVRYGELYTKFGAIITETYSRTNIDPANLRFSKGGEILVPRVGEKPDDFGKCCCYLPLANIAIGEMISVFETEEHPLFYTYYFRLLYRQFAKVVEGQNVKNLYYTELEPLPIHRPTLPEQQKIAACLSSVDELLAAQARKLDALKTHKKGLAQQLFPREGETEPRLRFPEFQNAGAWEEKQLGDTCILVRGPFGGSLKKEIFVESGYAVYEQSHAIYGDFTSFRYYIPEAKYDELKRFSVKPGDIIMSCSGTMGKFAIVPQGASPGVINQALLMLSVKPSCIPVFLKEVLELPTNQEQLLSQSAGGAIKNVVSVSQIKELELLIPSLAEQRRIVDCLSCLDDLIAAQSAKLEALKTHKKGLMQQLFPSLEEVEA